MTVESLIAKLIALGKPAATVAVYSAVSEDMDFVHDVRVENDEVRSGCKGDHILAFQTELKEVVVIR